MSGTVVEELCNRKVGALGGTRLFVGNGAECHEDGDIDTAGIVEYGPNDLLNAGDTVFVEGWGVVRKYGKLGGFAVLFWGALMWAVLGFGAFMAKALEDLLDIARHRDINCFIEVVPFKHYTTV